jgi:hypothetical protein
VQQKCESGRFLESIFELGFRFIKISRKELTIRAVIGDKLHLIAKLKKTRAKMQTRES